MKLTPKPCHFCGDTILRYGEPQDFLYIDSLRKIEGNALGFIPAEVLLSVLERRPHNTDGNIRKRYLYQSILITEDNGDKTGYAFVSYSKDIVTIFQIVVQQDARRWHRALMMIDEVEKQALLKQKVGIKARVAYDLESNQFWQAIGYTITEQTISTWLNQRESQSKRPINIYFKPLMPLFSL